MQSTTPNTGEPKFSIEKIKRQVDRILADPHFASSEVLRKFLRFIVTETIEGRSNCLKEYTIALKVLNKPKTFKPKENCIVRIHAVRLRKALQNYFSGPGSLDEIRIILPKGNYVPVFSDNMEHVLNSVLSDQPSRPEVGIIDEHSMTTAVIPFHYHDRKQMVRNFSDGLGIQLSSALMRIKSLSVISYNISRRVPEKFADVRDIGHLFHAQFVFTGDVQCQKNTMRVTVQMIKANTSEQIWSEMFERKVTENNRFKVQDEIIDQVIKAMYQQGKILIQKNKGVSIMAVA
jgi:TolB-like protein